MRLAFSSIVLGEKPSRGQGLRFWLLDHLLRWYIAKEYHIERRRVRPLAIHLKPEEGHHHDADGNPFVRGAITVPYRIRPKEAPRESDAR